MRASLNLLILLLIEALLKNNNNRKRKKIKGDGCHEQVESGIAPIDIAFNITNNSLERIWMQNKKQIIDFESTR